VRVAVVITVVVMFAGALLAFFFPEPFLAVAGGLRPAFGVTMLFVGTLVRPEQVRTFLAAPTRPLSGLVAQYTIMPLVACAISLLFADPNLRIGIVLVGCMPGAMASNVMTVLFRGDLLLSVTMTAVATLLCPLVLALWLPLLVGTRVHVPVSGLVGDALLLVVLPVVVGITARYVLRSVPAWWDRVATIIASAAITLIVLVVVAANRDSLATSGAAIAGAMIALNLGGYALAFVFATLMRWPPRQRRTLVIEVGMQNAGLGSVLAASHLGAGGALPSAFYTALCVLTAAAALPLVRRIDGETKIPVTAQRRR
jgi:BASS family bile acid:Na+ symporter